MVSRVQDPGALNLESREFLSNALSHLRPVWEEALQRRRAVWRADDRHNRVLAAGDQIDLDPLTDYLLATDSVPAESEECFLERVRREDYSAADLYVELLAAQEALPVALAETSEPTVDTAKVQAWSEARMEDLFLRILEETSCVYESMAESGRRGYCQIDEQGRILFANRGLKTLIGDEALHDKNLWELFGESATESREELSVAEPPRAITRQLDLTIANGRAIPVLAEFATIAANRGASGAYVGLTDLSEVRQAFRVAQTRIFSAADFGIIRTRRDRAIAFANPAALEIIGVDDVEGWKLEDLPIKREAREELLRSFERRLQGESDTYELILTRQSDGREIPVKVSAVPEVGAGGVVVGAFAIIHSQEFEVASHRLRSIIETARSGSEILASVDAEVGGLLEFEDISVQIYSRDGFSSRPIFRRSHDSEIFQTTRWYESNSTVREWRLNPDNRVIEDLEQFLKDHGDHALLEHPDVKRLLERGVVYWYNQPIYLENEQVAGISLGTDKPENLARAREVMDALPLAEAIRMVMQFLKSREHDFRLGLLRSLQASTSALQAAGILTKEIAAHFEWDNVAIYRPQSETNTMLLLEQSLGPSGVKREERECGPLDESLAGHAARTREITRLSALDEADAPRACLAENTRSALCVPISVGDVTPFLLQIEDQLTSAFVEEDVEALERILSEARGVLGNLSEHYRLRHVFANASDALVTCTNSGRILEVNGPAVDLFCSSEGELLSQQMQTLFADPKLCETVLRTPRYRDVTRVQGADGKPVKVLVTSFRMPEGFDRNLFIIQNLTLYERLAELERVRSMFGDIAHQTRAPMSIMHGSLRRLAARHKDDELNDFVQRMEGYLRKVELTYSQLILYDAEQQGIPYHPVLIQLDQLLHRTIDQLPKSEHESISQDFPADLPMVRVDVYRMDFVLSTIIGHYLRFIPVDETVQVGAKRIGRRVELTVAGTLPEPVPLHGDLESLGEFAASLGIDNPMVTRFIREMGGEYEPPTPPDQPTAAIRLPVCED